jgi:phosphopantothenoylcysteine decarboxylase
LHAATAIGDPDAAADAISDLLLKGYALLSSTCPEPTCRGIPLVGFPRRRDGSKDPRRECVSCGQRWVDEKDLAASGLRMASAESSVASPVATPTPARQGAVLHPATPSDSGDEPESPRTRARRELYDQGNAIMQARADAAAMKKAEEEALKMAGLDARGIPLSPEAGPSTLEVKGKSAKKKKAKAEPKYEPKAHVPSIRSKPFAADDHRPASPDGKLRVVLVTTGSVASIKMPLIVEALGADANVDVQVVATGSSLHFYDAAAIEDAHDGVGVWADADEWSDWNKIGDPILHIELRRWADLVMVVPCSADMLAKIAGGICDNLAVSLDARVCS